MSPAIFFAPGMKPPSDNELIRGIKIHDSAILIHVYDTYYPVIEGYIIHNQGTVDQARDIFQDAMIIVYNRIRSDELVLSCKFGTYLYAICKNLWTQERKKYLHRVEILRQQPLQVNDPGPDDDPLLQHHLTDLSSSARIARRSFPCISTISVWKISGLK